MVLTRSSATCLVRWAAVCMFLLSTRVVALCGPDAPRYLPPGIDKLFTRLVETRVLAPGVTSGWHFEQIRALSDHVELRLTTAGRQQRTINLYLNGTAEPGDVIGHHFRRLSVLAGTPARDGQALLRLARILDDAVTDADLPTLGCTSAGEGSSPSPVGTVARPSIQPSLFSRVGTDSPWLVPEQVPGHARAVQQVRSGHRVDLREEQVRTALAERVARISGAARHFPRAALRISEAGRAGPGGRPPTGLFVAGRTPASRRLCSDLAFVFLAQWKQTGGSPPLWADTINEELDITRCLKASACLFEGNASSAPGFVQPNGWLHMRVFLAALGVDLDGVQLLLVLGNVLALVVIGRSADRLGGWIAAIVAMGLAQRYLGAYPLVFNTAPMMLLGAVFLAGLIRFSEEPRLSGLILVSLSGAVMGSVYVASNAAIFSVALMTLRAPRRRIRWALAAVIAFALLGYLTTPTGWVVNLHGILRSRAALTAPPPNIHLHPFADVRARRALVDLIAIMGVWSIAAVVSKPARRVLDATTATIIPPLLIFVTAVGLGRIPPEWKHLFHLAGPLSVLPAVTLSLLIQALPLPSLLKGGWARVWTFLWGLAAVAATLLFAPLEPLVRQPPHRPGRALGLLDRSPPGGPFLGKMRLPNSGPRPVCCERSSTGTGRSHSGISGRRPTRSSSPPDRTCRMGTTARRKPPLCSRRSTRRDFPRRCRRPGASSPPMVRLRPFSSRPGPG